MPSPAVLLLAAALLPLVAFLLLTFMGKRLGNPLAGYVGTIFTALSFAASVFAMMKWLGGGTFNAAKWGSGEAPINMSIPWIPGANGNWLEIGIYIDSLTVMMFGLVTLVSTLVHVFSMGYMRHDHRFPRFFTYLSLFNFAMLGLVLGSTLLQLLIFWELVGLCSYLLIGFWFEKKSASNAAIKAFVTNRIGDVGFIVGLGILFYYVGNVTLPNLWTTLHTATTGSAVTLGSGLLFAKSTLTITGVCLFCGAIGKSAQFPLHVWLPDAMEGPTPVSALIHAATMVTAGVYLVARIFPILTPGARLFIAIIGCITLTMAALIAMAQTDIKKVLAYSTVSQLGYMMLAMGVGSWVGGLFHLLTHGFFKALLFLGAGSVIDAAHHEQELSEFGGLLKRIPVTAITFGIAVLALSGTPGLSGFYSKDLILAHAGAFASLAVDQTHHKSWWLLFILPAAMALVSAFYMTRCWALTFLGKPRNENLHGKAKERPAMWVPLVVLAVLSIVAGNHLGIREMLDNARMEATNLCQRELGEKTKFAGFSASWTEIASDEAMPDTHLQHGHVLVEKYVYWLFAIGIAFGLLIYARGFGIAHTLMKIPPLGALRMWLNQRMYFDELYFALFISTTIALSQIAGFFDKFVVDGAVNGIAWLTKQLSFGIGAGDGMIVDGAVNGVAALAQDVGVGVRAAQAGRVRLYVAMLIGMIAFALAAIVLWILVR